MVVIAKVALVAWVIHDEVIIVVVVVFVVKVAVVKSLMLKRKMAIVAIVTGVVVFSYLLWVHYWGCVVLI